MYKTLLKCDSSISLIKWNKFLILLGDKLIVLGEVQERNTSKMREKKKVTLLCPYIKVIFAKLKWGEQMSISFKMRNSSVM